jgi:lactoylglutathione lyase
VAERNPEVVVFTEAFPIYSTPDLARALRFYRDLLGGVETYRFPADGPPAYVGLRIGASEVGLGEDAAVGAPSEPRAVSLCVYADDCDDAVALLRGAGVAVLAEPTDQAWGERMATVADPDGNPVIIMSRP